MTATGWALKQVVAILKTLLVLTLRVLTILPTAMIAGCTTATDNATEYFNRGNAHVAKARELGYSK
jgi:hypothetical protein